jgi:hypothetical protein
VKKTRPTVWVTAPPPVHALPPFVADWVDTPPPGVAAVGAISLGAPLVTAPSRFALVELMVSWSIGIALRMAAGVHLAATAAACATVPAA